MNHGVKSLMLLAVLVSGLTVVYAETEKSGSWTRQEYKIVGSWSIVEEDGRRIVRLSDDFKTKSAPDLKIYLSRLELDSVTGKNATQDSVLVAPLKSNQGGQAYALPDSIDLSEFKSILIHCEKYSKLWGGSAL